ncbi:MAG: twin-arginine translocation signal domain-containing protein, partial [Candidatus Omnitrophica bacterium]|nr:twin-arginine translocation signal domain-containing protein [Candidatus Omnitrophota bacterium]
MKMHPTQSRRHFLQTTAAAGVAIGTQTY